MDRSLESRSRLVSIYSKSNLKQNLLLCFSQNIFFRGRATGEQDFSKSTYSNLLKLGMIVHKWCVHIATEAFVCKMYVVYVSKLLVLQILFFFNG